jgi:hypothetical protein
MERLLAAGALYLIVIAIILTIKPSFMFTEEGDWKEFGIGRNPNTHTWMPFWLFAILLALMSYILVTLLLGLRGGDTSTPTPLPEQIQPINTSTKKANLPKNQTPILDDVLEVEPEDMEISVKPRRNRRAPPPELEEGYYILNQKATEAAGGIPKYIYLGKGLSE